MKKESTTTTTISSTTKNCSSSILTNGTQNTIKDSLNTIINIFIDGVEFKDDELDMLKSMSRDNVKKLLLKLKKLQRPFGKEQIKDMDDEDRLYEFIMRHKHYPNGLFNLTSNPMFYLYSRKQRIDAINIILRTDNVIKSNSIFYDKN